MTKLIFNDNPIRNRLLMCVTSVKKQNSDICRRSLYVQIKTKQSFRVSRYLLLHRNSTIVFKVIHKTMNFVQSSSERKLKLCAMPTCQDKRYDLVHKFPMDNERAQQWLDIIDLPELSATPLDQIRKRYFICSKHFRKQDYKNCESRSLNKTAYPRLNLRLNDDSIEDDLQIEYVNFEDSTSQNSVESDIHCEQPTKVESISLSDGPKSPQIRLMFDSSSKKVRVVTKPTSKTENAIAKKIITEKPTNVQSQGKETTNEKLVPELMGISKSLKPELILKKYTGIKPIEKVKRDSNQLQTPCTAINLRNENVNTYIGAIKPKSTYASIICRGVVWLPLGISSQP